MMGRGKKRREYVNLPLAFDIETTSTVINGDKVAWCYHWQLGVGDHCYYGRDLKDAKYVFDDLAERFDGRYLIMWVHNLSYEFGFAFKDLYHY